MIILHFFNNLNINLHLKNMKKVSINLLGLLLFTTMIFACGNNSNNNHDVEVEDDTNNIEVVKDEVENKIDFSKFEHYTKILTKKDLTAQFGEANLRDLTESYAEGTVEKEATILTNPKNGQVIKFIWDDDNAITSWIEVHYNIYDESYELIGTQKIDAENGLSLGMSLSELKDWNGDDFKFSGFGWDYAGTIYAEAGSKIIESPIRITLDILTYEGADFTIGDVVLRTDDSRLDNVNIIVAVLTMHID